MTTSVVSAVNWTNSKHVLHGHIIWDDEELGTHIELWLEHPRECEVWRGCNSMVRPPRSHRKRDFPFALDPFRDCDHYASFLHAHVDMRCPLEDEVEYSGLEDAMFGDVGHPKTFIDVPISYLGNLGFRIADDLRDFEEFAIPIKWSIRTYRASYEYDEWDYSIECEPL